MSRPARVSAKREPTASLLNAQNAPSALANMATEKASSTENVSRLRSSTA